MIGPNLRNGTKSMWAPAAARTVGIAPRWVVRPVLVTPRASSLHSLVTSRRATGVISGATPRPHRFPATSSAPIFVWPANPVAVTVPSRRALSLGRSSLSILWALWRILPGSWKAAALGGATVLGSLSYSIPALGLFLGLIVAYYGYRVFRLVNSMRHTISSILGVGKSPGGSTSGDEAARHAHRSSNPNLYHAPASAFMRLLEELRSTMEADSLAGRFRNPHLTAATKDKVYESAVDAIRAALPNSDHLAAILETDNFDRLRFYTPEQVDVTEHLSQVNEEVSRHTLDLHIHFDIANDTCGPNEAVALARVAASIDDTGEFVLKGLTVTCLDTKDTMTVDIPAGTHQVPLFKESAPRVIDGKWREVKNE
ncbi:hypothetical protein IWQ60_004086 [Tieghemiomyces parasiticus]|uniref:Uncharacterized protein n=1 Tax=Tieghemiomyces parasiticus TaxID=78921 RepID=A0A9W8A9K5_9FUNG|nr:hypothetical protein IWQ60_004086 [Tieghemiomyces parasiticus]